MDLPSLTLQKASGYNLTLTDDTDGPTLVLQSIAADDQLLLSKGRTTLLTLAAPGANGGNGGTPTPSDPEFLPTPTLVDDSNTDYFYWGWEIVINGYVWLVRRTTIATGQTEDATPDNNPSITNITDAWANRITLTYG